MPSITVSPANSGIQSATLTLTSAQILSIFTTGVEIVPAPGAGLAHWPLMVVGKYIPGTTQYTDAGGALAIYWGGTVLAVQIGATSSFWTQTDKRGLVDTVPAALEAESSISNKNLQVKQSVANPTLGNGTVQVFLQYVTLPW